MSRSYCILISNGKHKIVSWFRHPPCYLFGTKKTVMRKKEVVVVGLEHLLYVEVSFFTLSPKI